MTIAGIGPPPELFAMLPAGTKAPAPVAPELPAAGTVETEVWNVSVPLEMSFCVMPR